MKLIIFGFAENTGYGRGGALSTQDNVLGYCSYAPSERKPSPIPEGCSFFQLTSSEYCLLINN